MANDAPNKSNSNDSVENASLSNAGDQQKVPPLRIVLNSTSNQKSLSTTTTQQTSTKSEKAQDARQEGALKTTGKVRIKLGANRQQSSKGNNDNDTNDTTNKTDNHKSKEKSDDKQEENLNEDSISSNFNHLRRITRRSQRSVQSIANEDEESISSMTSVDENLINTNNNQPTSDTTQDPEQSNSTTALTKTASAVASNATNGSSNVDTPRRHKRRKVESSESQALEYDTLLGTQNYKLPSQNSFELFKNIRKQVDKKLKSLNYVHPKTPHGFREYMLTRGTYLLDGNKLGNGTSLFMNEHGGLNTAPIGKFHIVRHNRTNYSVPNRSKIPLGLSVSSPLYNLFTEQEKERYRMRLQHIREREKLTLTVEQEFMRVYSQAALAAVDQKEPFSVCTMLKHQEVYNYVDSDGETILSREDAQQDHVSQSGGVRTRRRQHEHISPVPARKGSNPDETGSADILRKDSESSNSNGDKKFDPEKVPSLKVDNEISKTAIQDGKQSGESEVTLPSTDEPGKSSIDKSDSKQTKSLEESKKDCTIKSEESETGEKTVAKVDCLPPESSDVKQPEESKGDSSNSEGINKEPPNSKANAEPKENSTSDDTNKIPGTKEHTSTFDEDQSDQSSESKSAESVASATDEEKKAINKELFLIKLQEIDDKWEKIRREMWIRHQNEAESLHAIQKLEWEWKTKEIGTCDVRATPTIDNSLVPKLEIFSLDY